MKRAKLIWNAWIFWNQFFNEGFWWNASKKNYTYKKRLQEKVVGKVRCTVTQWLRQRRHYIHKTAAINVPGNIHFFDAELKFLCNVIWELQQWKIHSPHYFKVLDSCFRHGILTRTLTEDWSMCMLNKFLPNTPVILTFVARNSLVP